MKAAILREFKGPLTIEEVARPKPDAHEALIKVEACGVCHPDLHVAAGEESSLPDDHAPVVRSQPGAGSVAEGAGLRQSCPGQPLNYNQV
jgi:alcohol dehydrogenase, propanol-preferring